MRLRAFCGLAAMFLSNAKASENDFVAAVVILEAVGEGERGMQAVVNVIANRARQHGCSFYSVVTRPAAFSSVREGSVFTRAAQISGPRYQEIANNLVRRAAEGVLFDLTGGATFFHSGSPPFWTSGLVQTASIGRHKFYRAPDGNG